MCEIAGALCVGQSSEEEGTMGASDALFVCVCVRVRTYVWIFLLFSAVATHL